MYIKIFVIVQREDDVFRSAYKKGCSETSMTPALIIQHILIHEATQFALIYIMQFRCKGLK